ncbi:MAG: T9SS type A sorting domain-containing protein [Saprospiraceae bacterium]|nr:T9SS type A sorting domain-containing protein [Saprospiraceae bacterium]
MKLLLLASFNLLLFSSSLSSQWVTTEGPYGGYVWETHANDSYIFAVKQSGIYRSSDEGLHWEACNYEHDGSRLQVEGSRLLASFGSLESGEMSFSPDNGNLWFKVQMPPDIPLVTNFSVTGNTILFTHANKLWHTANLGQQWNQIEFAGEPFQRPFLLGTFEGKVYASNRTRLLSSENGVTWSYIGTVPGNAAANNIRKFAKHGNMMVSLVGQTLGRSLNEGLQWDIAASDANQNLGNNTRFSCESNIWYASTGKQMFHSTDGGLSWSFIDPDGPFIYYHSSKNNVIIGHQLGYGLFRSTDGGQNWQPANSGLSGSDVLTIGAHQQALWVWDESGASRQDPVSFNWDVPPTFPVSSLIGAFNTIYSHKTALFVRRDHNELWRTTDEGQTWQQVTPAPAIVSSDFVEFNQKGDSLFLTGEYFDTYLSTDMGDHWTLLNPEINSQIGSSMKDMAATRTGWFVSDQQNVYRFDEAAHNWMPAGAPAPFGDTVDWIRLYGTPRFLFAHVDLDRIFHSADHGETWTEVFFPFQNNLVYSAEYEVTFTEIGDEVVAFFEREGLFVSHDLGLTWDSHNEGLPAPTLSTGFAFIGERMWIGMYYYGLYERPVSDLEPLSVHTAKGSNNPVELFPNPSNGRVVCKINQPIAGMARFEIYNLQGQVMQQNLVAAQQEQELDVRVPPGTYCLRVITAQGHFSQLFQVVER